MDKKTLSVIGGVIAVAIIAIIGWGVVSGQKASAPTEEVSGTVYFYGAECPHCKKVNEFIEANGIDAKVSFEKKEVWHDRANAKQMSQAALQCGLAQEEVGVPFLFDNGTCLIGEPEVIKFFSERAGLGGQQ